MIVKQKQLKNNSYKFISIKFVQSFNREKSILGGFVVESFEPFDNWVDWLESQISSLDPEEYEIECEQFKKEDVYIDKYGNWHPN